MSDTKRRWWLNIEVPHTYVIIFCLMLLASLASFVIPGGAYERNEQKIHVGAITHTKMVVDSDSFHYVPAVPQGPWAMINSVMKGLRHHDASDIVFFILLIGGAFGIITETRAVEAALARLVTVLGTRERYIIPVVMVAFSIGGASFGMCEETIPFIAMVVPLSLRLGYDSITGVAMVYIGAMIGFASAFLNPFTVGIAQGIAGVPIFSGFAYRVGIWALLTGVTIVWVMRYAARIKDNPKLSPVFELDEIKRVKAAEQVEHPTFTGSRKAVLGLIVCGFGSIIYGAIELGWYIDEMVAVFLTIGIVAGLVNRLKLNTIAESFGRGCAQLANAAILVGFARAVLVILENARAMDTILHSVAGVVGKLPPVISVQCMFLFQTMTNFFVPSGSGQAALTMPIMAPLADMVGVTRQTAVLAYQFGDGFTNMIIPTSAVTIAVLGMAGVPWDKWARWILPLMVIYYILGVLLLIPPVMMTWQG